MEKKAGPRRMYYINDFSIFGRIHHSYSLRKVEELHVISKEPTSRTSGRHQPVGCSLALTVRNAAESEAKANSLAGNLLQSPIFPTALRKLRK